jgi:hypothetical protein
VINEKKVTKLEEVVGQKFANFLLNNKNFYSKRKQKAKCKKI